MEADVPPEALIAGIAAAFDGVSREDGITLHEADEIDCHGSPEERIAARLLDSERRWQDVPDEWIEEFSSAYCFMDAKGFRYYLPPAMIWSVRHGAESDSATSDNVADLLLRRESCHLRDSLIPILTPTQCGAIARWLLYSGWQIAELRQSVWTKYLCG